MNNVHLATQAFLQLAVILVACRVVGAVAARLRQPQVVAQMIAGVLLGPSFFGLLAPEWKEWLFPWDPSQSVRDTQSYLFPASQFGLALYMFVVGMEFDVAILRCFWKASAAVSVAGMVAPFVLGAGIGWYCQRNTTLFTVETNATEAMLFLGAALCITAFPMLARIIHFKGLAGSRMGTVAIGAGALGDACAWCLLAVVVASFKNRMPDAAVHIGAGALFLAVTVLLVRPLLHRFESVFLSSGRLSERGLVLAVSLMSIGAWITDSLGFHVVFGSFVLGAVLPRGAVTRGLIASVEPITVAVLLPLFFTYSGLNTQVATLVSTDMAVVFITILAAAIIGKGGACYFAARWAGIAHHEAMGIGTLMNARGLMELIIIDIGLERGVITPSLFSALMMMAVVTTLMTSPLFDGCLRTRRPAALGSTHDGNPLPMAAAEPQRNRRSGVDATPS